MSPFETSRIRLSRDSISSLARNSLFIKGTRGEARGVAASTQFAPSEKSRTTERGWKGGDRGGAAQKNQLNQKKEKTDLTHTGLLMERLRWLSLPSCYF